MTQQQHPIAPSPELVQQWTDEIYGGPGAVVGSDDICLAKLAAQWGADQELEACCEWGDKNLPVSAIHYLRAERRPKPPSLKEQALEALDSCSCDEADSWKLIRRALEQLPEGA